LIEGDEMPKRKLGIKKGEESQLVMHYIQSCFYAIIAKSSQELFNGLQLVDSILFEF